MNNTTISIADVTFFYDEMRGILTDRDGSEIKADVQKISDGEFSVLINGKSVHFFITHLNNSVSVTVNNCVVEINRETMRDKLAKQLQKGTGQNIGIKTTRAPMPGLITKIMKSEGSPITVGEGILVVEAMKMENEIKSSSTGILRKIFVMEKQTVEKNDNLFTIEQL